MAWLDPVPEVSALEAGMSDERTTAGALAWLFGVSSVLLVLVWGGPRLTSSAEHGLEQRWFSDDALNSQVAIARTGVVNHRWSELPVADGETPPFSATWRGCLRVTDRDRRVVVRSSGGVRVRVGGGRMVDRWKRTTPHYHRSKRSLKTGVHSLELDFTTARADGFLYLGWAIRNRAHVPIPLSALLPPEHPDCVVSR